MAWILYFPPIQEISILSKELKPANLNEKLNGIIFSYLYIVGDL